MKPRLRVVHVVRQYAPAVGGLETVVARLAHEQKSRLGYDVAVVTLDRLFTDPERRLVASEVVDDIPVRRLPWRGSSRYPICPGVLSHLSAADLVHVHGIDFFFDWLSATRALHRKPLIASTHGGFFHTSFASTLKRLWFASITRASALGYRRLIAISDHDGELFRRIAPTRVEVVENGAEIERFRDASPAERVPVLLYFGRWSSNKGLPALIDLVAALRRRDDRWRLIVAGRPYDLTRSALESQIARHGLADAVELHEAPSDAALRDLMSRASYFACLSRHEGFGIAAIEAMSAGLVPILSDIPPFRKLVTGAGAGLLLSHQETADVSAERVARMNAAPARERDDVMRFVRRYDWASVADRHDAVYREALALDDRKTRAPRTVA